jgi:hypothetical protein
LVACSGLCLVVPAATRAQTPDPPSHFQWSVANTSRFEAWSFFQPPPTGGDPDYGFIANRLRLTATGSWPGIELAASAQYVQFGNLPVSATGPGALGTGALYYSHSGRTDPHGIYLRTALARIRAPAGIEIQAGRFPYQSGSESPSGRPKIEAVKRARIDSRLIGEFEWSIFQRTFDGVRGDVDRAAWHVSASWFTPTQGGFENDAGARMPGVDLSNALFTLRPSVALPATDLSVFVVGYRDDRQVSARPDNTGLGADRADVAITTFGASAVGSATAERGEVDWLVWFAGQTGSWYAQSHRAWSLALEGGYQWKSLWQPWVRAGHLHASGDADPADDRHHTFFPLLPTVRKYAFTTAYATMNLNDAFVELILRPSSTLTLRADVHRLWLAKAADLWYSGSGATQQSGSFFGYAGRRSGNVTGLGTVLEGATDVSIGPHWSVNGFIGVIHGGPVVASSFADTWLRFAYFENVIRF